MHEYTSIKGFLLDMDGVLYVGDTLIPGASATLAFLRQHKLPFRFITNTTTSTPDELLNKLKRLGLDARREEIFSAVSATAKYLSLRGQPSLYLLVKDSVKPCFAQFPLNDVAPDFVVLGDIGDNWDYHTLNQVFNMLMRGSKLICMHRNKYWQAEEGLRMDIGAFVAALEYVANTRAIVIGKPVQAFFQFALASLQLPPDKVAVIGDDIEVDIGGGQSIGLQGILVKTGKYREELVQQASVKPEHVLSSIAALPELLAHLNL